MLRKIFLLTVLCGSLAVFLWAQKSVSAPKQPPVDLTQTQDMAKFSVTLQQVLAEVLVYDRRHDYVLNLQPEQFRLYDNNREQSLTNVDVVYTPISMVICIQANNLADKILPQVNKIGNMLKPIVLGDQGEAAVIAYDHRVRLMQPFTNDADEITAAVKAIHAGSESSRTIDAIEQSAFLLAHRDKNRRRLILMIGETRDGGSQARLRETLQKVQLANVGVYWVDMSRLLGKLTEPTDDPRPMAQPPAAMGPMGGGNPSTPTTVEQATGTGGYGFDAFPLMLEIFRDVKNIFKVAPAKAFTLGTGGEQFTFASEKSLEAAISRLGDELHSQYLLTYTPNNMGDGGFHHISVEVVNRADFKCETKPGYFMSPVFPH